MNWYKQIQSLYQNQPISVTRVGLATDLASVHLFNIFQITGGNVLIESISGISRHAVQGASTQTLEGGFTPTGIVRQIWAVASANTVTIVGAENFLTWSGVIPAAIIINQTGVLYGVGMVGGVLAGTTGAINVFTTGIIDITTAAGTDNVGLIDWTIVYRPLTPTSLIVAL